MRQECKNTKENKRIEVCEAKKLLKRQKASGTTEG